MSVIIPTLNTDPDLFWACHLNLPKPALVINQCLAGSNTFKCYRSLMFEEVMNSCYNRVENSNQVLKRNELYSIFYYTSYYINTFTISNYFTLGV